MCTAKPRWMIEAERWIGTTEIPGPQHNPTIMGWVRKLGRKLGITVIDDETPWCGTFMAYVMDTCGLQTPSIAVRAAAWGDWGQWLPFPSPGAVLVFTRKGGGHVGLYVGEDDTAYHVLGGNQSNSVNITRIAKTRLSAIRWPPGEPLPETWQVLLARNGEPLSQNEA